MEASRNQVSLTLFNQYFRPFFWYFYSIKVTLLHKLFFAKKDSDAEAFIDFGDEEDVDLEEIKRKQDEEFDFTGMMKQSAAASKKEKPSSNKGASLYLFVFDNLLNKS